MTNADKFQPNVIQRIERWRLNRDEIEELIKESFNSSIFLDGKPGTAQKVEFSFDWGHNPHATVVVTTLEQDYKERSHAG